MEISLMSITAKPCLLWTLRGPWKVFDYQQGVRIKQVEFIENVRDRKKCP